MRTFLSALALASLLAAAAMGQQNAQQPTPAPQDKVKDAADIAPPADLNIAPPVEEVVPAPQGCRPDRVRLGRDLERGPEGRRFLHRSGEGGLEFGLDMAQRGINFGLRYAHGQATPADARAFGLDMGRRGKAFGLEMRDRALEIGDDAADRLPVDGRDAKFKETPGDITIEAPPLPVGADAPRGAAPKIYGREPTARPAKFRREF